MGHDGYISGAEHDAPHQQDLQLSPQTGACGDHEPTYIVGIGFRSQNEDLWEGGQVPNTMTVTKVDLPFTP